MTDTLNMEEPSLQTAPPPPPTIPNNIPSIDISTGTEVPNVTTIDLRETNNPPELTKVGIENRAKTLHYALQDRSPGPSALQRTLEENREHEIQTGLAFEQKFKQEKVAMGIISNIVKSRKGEPLSAEEEQMVYTAAQEAGNVDPNTIVEKVWAKNYVKELLHTPAQAVAAGLAASPVTSMHVAGVAAKIVTLDQVAMSVKQKFDKRYEDLPIIGTSWNNKADAWLTTFIPGMNWLTVMNSIPKEAKEYMRSYFPGSTMREFKEYLTLIGPEKAKPILEQFAETVWKTSPVYAMEFLSNMIDYPSSAAATDNILGVVDVATVFPGTKVARGTVAAGREAKDIIDRAMVSTLPKEAQQKAAEGYAIKVDAGYIKNNENILFTPKEVRDILTQHTLVVKEYKGPGKVIYKLETDPKAFPEYGSAPATSTPQSYYGTLSDNSGATIKPDLVNGRAVKIDQKLAEVGDRANRTATNPRAMSPEELRKAAGAVPEDHSYPPTYLFDQPSAGSVGPPRGIPEGGYNLSRRDLDRIGDGTPGYSLSKRFDLTDYRAAVSEKNRISKQLDEAKAARDSAHENGADSTAMSARQAVVKELEKAEAEATTKVNTVSVYNTHPAIARAEQAMRAYFSAGIRAVHSLVPSGTGIEIKYDLQGGLTKLGRSEEAIKTGAVRQATEALSTKTVDPVQELNSWSKDLPSSHRPNPFIENASSYTREGSSRVAHNLVNNAELLQSTLQDAQRVQRTTEEDILKLYNQAKDTEAAKFTGSSQNSVLDQELIYDPAYNVYFAKTKIGKTDGTGFADHASAQNSLQQIYGISPNDMLIMQEGNSYYGHVLTPIDERGSIKTTSIQTIKAANNETPSFWGMNWALIRATRSGDDTISPLQMQARLTATHAPQQITKNINQVANSVKFVGKEKDELGHMLNMSSYDRDANGNLGKWWNKTELEMAFGQKYGRMPSDNVVEGYATYRQLMDLDYEMRKNYIYSHWSREGFKQHKFSWEGGESVEFYGRKVDKLDNDKVRDRAILYVDNDGKASIKWSIEDYKNNKNGFRDDIDRLIKEEGYEIVQLGQPLKHPLKDVKGGDVYFAITNKNSSRYINPEEVLPYRGGPHIMYTHGHFIGQPVITKDLKGQATYNGDNPFRNGGSSEAEGKVWATKYDTARKLMNSGDDQVLADFLRDNLPEGVDDFKKLFTGENALNRDMPIAWHPHGRSILDANPTLSHGNYNGHSYGFGDLKSYFTDLSNPESKLNSGFIQERANQKLLVPKDMGNTIPQRFQLEDAPIIDPFVSINRGLRQANRVRYMEDYKILAAESFIKEFGVHIKDASREALERNPMHWLYEGQIDTGAPHDIKGKMEQFRANVQNFIGMQSDLSLDISHFESKMQDAMYKTLGGNKTAAILERPFVQDYAVPFIKDPASYARAAAFKLRMGLFNPVQYWQQSQAVAAVLAISPKAGMEGAGIATYLQAGGRYALDDPAKLDHYAAMIAKSTRWTKDEAKEVLTSYKNSGVGIVGQETSYKNLFAEPSMFKDSWLDKGDFFFNHGEGYTRDTAYFTSFREWKDANPGRSPNQFDLGEILRRTNDMTFSMTRASNSSLQNNSWSAIPLQFQTFRIRQAELMLGGLKGWIPGVEDNGRITRQAAARMWGTYATLYGIPVAASAPVGIYSFYDDIRVAAMEKGYNLNDPYFKAMHEGILALIVHAATGKNLNIATAWGPGGSSLVNDIRDSIMGKENSKTIGELVAGPVGGSFQSAYFATTPVARWAWSKTFGEDAYPLTTEDFIRYSTIATSTDNARAAWQAYNVGREFTKKGMYVGDVTTWDGFVKLAFGLSKREHQDAFLWMKDINQVKGWQEDGKKEIRALYGAALKNMSQGEEQLANDKFTQIRTLIKKNDLPADEIAQLFHQTGDTSLIERLSSKLYPHPRASQRQKNMNDLNQGVR